MIRQNNKISINDENDHIKYNNNINNQIVSTKNSKDNLKKTEFNNLLIFIDKYKCDYGDKTFTHTWWSGSKGNKIFKIPADNYEEFIEIYIKELKVNFGKLHVMEKPLDIGPLCLDFDIKISKPLNCFMLVDVVPIIEIINEIIIKYYNLSANKKELESYVLTKNELYYDKEKKIYSDGFHLEYPNLIMKTIDRFLIFEESKNQIIKMGYFNEVFDEILQTKITLDSDNKYSIMETDINSDGDLINNEIHTNIMSEIYSEVFDSSVIKKNAWFMYGSGKNKNNSIKYYKFKYAFDANIDELDIKPTNAELVKLLSIRYENRTPISERLDLTNKHEFISSKYISKQSIKKDVKNLFIKNEDFEIDPNSKINLTNRLNKMIEPNLSNELIENIDMAKKLVKLFSKKRAGPYNDWITVGWALFNVSDTLLQEFIDFSRLDKQKYKEGCCEKIWQDCMQYNTNGKNGYTIASIYKWAKEDNPTEYANLIRLNVNKLLEEADIKTDYDIARVLKEMYKHDFKCSSISGNIWWQFDNHRWRRIDGAYTFALKMSTEVAKEFAKLSANYIIQSSTETGHRSDMFLKKSNDINKLISDLKKKIYKDRIISECTSLFYDPDFQEKLDENPNIIGFDNGVYDITNNIFRPGCPDDFLSFSTNYDYNSDYTLNHPEVIAIENFIKSIHPADDMRLYVMCYCASLLEGGNSDQKLIIWTGSGSNGKGTLIELIDHTLGDYFGTLPITLLTVKRKGSSNASPEIADKKGKRALVMQEPEHDDKINIGYMKELTGQDKIMGRALYSNPFYYVPQFKILLACNKLPEIPSDDGGTWRRIRVADHTQKFVDEPTKQNEHPKDPELRNKLKKWNKSFIWLLINKYYPIYKKMGLDKLEPESVKLSTKKYKQDSNIYLEYMEENLDLDTKESVSKEIIWNTFKEWYGNNYNDKKPPPMKKLVEFFTENSYMVKKGHIFGIKLKDISLDNINALDN